MTATAACELLVFKLGVLLMLIELQIFLSGPNLAPHLLLGGYLLSQGFASCEVPLLVSGFRLQTQQWLAETNPAYSAADSRDLVKGRYSKA